MISVMDQETKEALSLCLTLPPAERKALAQELLRSVEGLPSRVSEVGEAVPAYGNPLSGPAAGRVAFTLEYWQDESWYVGRLREVPGVFSQGGTLTELEDNIRDAYGLIASEAEDAPAGTPTWRKSFEVDA